MSKTLIILGKGPSRKHVLQYRKDYPGAELWTLNNFSLPGQDRRFGQWDPAKASDVHFDVHYDQRFWEIGREMQYFVVSPFRQNDVDQENMEAFPLEEVHRVFGHAYLESSLDYMLAYACLQFVQGTVTWNRFCVPGCDMNDPTHFSYRFGMHFWMGVAKGMGIELVIPPESAVLQRLATQKALDTDHEFPHIYGQPWELTEPLRNHYGWR